MRLCLLTFLPVLVYLSAANRCMAQAEWPKPIPLDSGAEIDVFKPQVTRYDRTVVQFKSIFSVLGSDPEARLFGMAWVTARVTVDSVHGRLLVKTYTVDQVSIPDDPDSGDVSMIWKVLNIGLANVIKELSLDEARQAERARTEEATGGGGDDGGLQVFFRTRPSVLVEMDGWPKEVYNESWRVEEVVNCSSTMVKDDGGKFYLYADWRWYRSAAALGPYTPVDEPAAWLKKLEPRAKSNAVVRTLRDPDAFSASKKTEPVGPAPDIVISTAPTMLIETDGDPHLRQFDQLSLSYVTNSESDIFLDSVTNAYYLLEGGQWYRGRSIQGESPWERAEPFELPESFSQIPVSSEKRSVRRFVPGTEEAEDLAVARQIPTVVRTDRYRTARVTYTSQPYFQRVKGTRLKYADNTCSIVLYDGVDYYTLFEGVWFVADNPKGFWTVSDHRPAEVEKIPDQYPVSRAKFVDVFGVSAKSVWNGYLPGYLEGPYDKDSCGITNNTIIGFPVLGPAEVARLLARAKEGKIYWTKPQGFRRTGLFSRLYY